MILGKKKVILNVFIAAKDKYDRQRVENALEKGSVTSDLLNYFRILKFYELDNLSLVLKDKSSLVTSLTMIPTINPIINPTANPSKSPTMSPLLVFGLFLDFNLGCFR